MNEESEWKLLLCCCDYAEKGKGGKHRNKRKKERKDAHVKKEVHGGFHVCFMSRVSTSSS